MSAESPFNGWEALYQDFVSFRMQRLERKNLSGRFDVPVDALARLAHPDGDDADWISQALRDAPERLVGRPSFVLTCIARIEALADVFFAPLVDAGVNEINPSRNRDFIELAVTFFGTVPVRRRLYHVFEMGTPFQQAGALNAMYWAQPAFPHSTSNGPAVTQRELDAYDAAREAATRELVVEHARLRRRALELFITTSYASLRHSIWAHVGLNEEDYPEELRPLVREAMRVAQSLDDGYIRAGIERAAGRSMLFAPIPCRDWEDAGGEQS